MKDKKIFEILKNKFVFIPLIVIVSLLVIGISYLLTSNTSSTLTGDEASYDESDDTDYFDDTISSDITLTKDGASVDSSSASIDGGIVTIKAAGVYNITGTISNGQIIVDVGDNDEVQIVLNGVDITCSSGPAIYVINAKKVVITLAEGTTNNITDGSNYDVDDTDITAAIFSFDDLTINGTGTLNVDANYQDGIVSHDDLKIMEGIINITAKDDAIRGTKSVTIKEGTINITSGADAIKSSGADTGQGNVIIDGGTITINAGDDGIHANDTLTINGGTINIKKSYEGIEGADIVINDGTIYIVASDDGINGAGGSDTNTTSSARDQFSTSSGQLAINGGYLYVDASGDGLDVNGGITMTDGTVIVNGPTNNGNGALDYDSTFVLSGGYFVAAGSSGMAMAPSSTSTQYSVLINFTSTISKGTLVHIESSTGTDIITFAASKNIQSIVVSTSTLTKGTYNIYTGGSSSSNVDGVYSGSYSGGSKYGSLTISSIVTTYGSTSKMR